MREAFDRENPGWEISATIPTSYWYLRGFDVKGIQKYLDYLNLMSYDLHGMWDQNIKFTGPYLEGHTDISQIELGLDLLWRNDIDPSNVVFGFAFYGRSFTIKDSSCFKPDRKCEFSDGGIAGSCTDTTGILSYAEISSSNNSLDVHTSYDPKTTVKHNVYGGTKWISYDDEQSFSDKKRFVSKRCLSGWMVQAIDQDNGEFDALTGLIGEDLSSLQMKSNEDSRSSHVLADPWMHFLLILKLKEYGVKQPPPDDILVRNNSKESWTFKRDYRATWITDGSKPDDGWNFVSRRWYSEGYEGDVGGEAIFCAMNHFGQDNVYKLETEKGKMYNGFYLRNDGLGMASDWQQMHNLGKYLITFGNTQGQTPDSTNTKRDSQS
ncbi:uncharacterized protein N7500_007379 [Penicillium coprophilum]|uniref:uncharacterized protein n=1 Tax=Penicillium coprophilum TaxID=36646 RepID=UPI002391DDAF|nr:uncharacterized protein N7500_007379 [Penicillium coprophilum]KAJ5165549.1 hypothetical protein N7500_007379 [Penicillium coprophilum]